MKMIVPGLVVATLFAVAATPVLAAPVWQSCEGLTKGESGSECAKEKSGGAYEWVELAETREVTSSVPELEVTDTKASGEALTIKCKATDVGWIGSGSSDGVSKITTSSCTRVSGTCEEGTVSLTAIDLPWGSTLENETKGIVDKTTSDGKGPPGYKLECGEGTSKLTDECHGTALAKLKNNEAKGTVEAEPEASPKDECTLGGKEAGEIKGDLAFKANREIRLEKGGLFSLTPALGLLRFKEVGSEKEVTIKNALWSTKVTLSSVAIVPNENNFELKDPEHCNGGVLGWLPGFRYCDIKIKMLATTATANLRIMAEADGGDLKSEANIALEKE